MTSPTAEQALISAVWFIDCQTNYLVTTSVESSVERIIIVFTDGCMLARHGDVGGKNESHALSIVTAVNIGCQALQVGFVINMIYLIVTLTFIAKYIAVKVLGILNDVKGTADGLSCIACLITIYWGKGYGIDA